MGSIIKMGRTLLVIFSLIVFISCGDADHKGEGGGGEITPVQGRIAAGGFHTCGLTSSSGVKCWGDNEFGQLGDGTTINSDIPVNVTGLSSGVVAVTAGAWHTCALVSSGDVMCWGQNWDGQVGDGGTEDYRDIPVNVIGLTSGAVKISAGYGHNCALTSSGVLSCWGVNGSGELGDGGTESNCPIGIAFNAYCSNIPVNVMNLSSGVKTISAGNGFTCALTSSGSVMCWGNNIWGELGDGTTINSDIPVNVSGLSSGVIAVSAGLGGHVCALSSSGGLKCWGDNDSGQLGNVTNVVINPLPVNVAGLGSGVAAVSAGVWHTCALTKKGAVKCWGENISGELGDGSTIESTSPKGVRGLGSGVVEISAGSEHTCALTDTGHLKCWGNNWYGRLGNGGGANSDVPKNVLGF